MNFHIRTFFGNKNDLGRRFAVFLTGLFICSFGVACTTKASLGTSPIAAIPYTLSLILPNLSFGTWLILFGMAQILVQIILLRNRCVRSELVIQFILAFAFGYLTDFSMYLLRGITPEHYGIKLLLLFIGCFVLAFGVYLELLGDVGMLSGDAFIKAIAQVTGKSYSNIKIITDVSMTLLSGLLCVVFLGRLEGVREGTILAALLVGPIIKAYQKALKNLSSSLFPA